MPPWFITGYYRIILHGPEPLIACLTVITKQSRLTGWLSCLMTFSTILCIDGFQFKACLLSQIQGLFGRTGSQVILFQFKAIRARNAYAATRPMRALP